MSSTLITLAAVCAANPFRAAACAPTNVDIRRKAIAVAAVLSLVAAGSLAVLSESILEWLNVSGSSSRIAAGAAVLLVGVRDLFIQPPSPEPGLKGWRAGIVPMAFPVILTPALAILAISTSSERGAATAVAMIGAAILLVAVIVLTNARGTYWRTATVGSAGVICGTLLLLNGVTAI